MMLSLRCSPAYSTVRSPTTPGQQSYAGGNTNCFRASYIRSPRWQGPSSYAPLILPHGVVSVPGWSAYSGQMRSISTTDSLQQAMKNGQTYGTSCQGDCKFGAVYQFHHPHERLLPAPDSVLSPMGLPLRPGEPLCVFYSRYGICKFGPSCKFDHPMGIFTYNISASPSADGPSRHLLGSSSGTAALNISSEGLVESSSAKPRRLSLSKTRHIF